MAGTALITVRQAMQGFRLRRRAFEADADRLGGDLFARGHASFFARSSARLRQVVSEMEVHVHHAGTDLDDHVRAFQTLRHVFDLQPISSSGRLSTAQVRRT